MLVEFVTAHHLVDLEAGEIHRPYGQREEPHQPNIALLVGILLSQLTQFIAEATHFLSGHIGL